MPVSNGMIYGQVTAGFSQPAVLGTIQIQVDDSSFFIPTHHIFIQSAGHYEVISVDNATHITVCNMGYAANIAPTTVTPFGMPILILGNYRELITGVQLLDNRMDRQYGVGCGPGFINAATAGYTVAGNKNNWNLAGVGGVALCPSGFPYTCEERYTQGWSFSPLAPVVGQHWSCIWDDYSGDGVSTRPDSATGYAQAFFDTNPSLGTAGGVRLEHGIDMDTLIYWYWKGHKTWHLRYWVAYPLNSSAIMNQNLGGINLSDCNSANMTVFHEIIDSANQNFVCTPQSSSIAASNAWQQITKTFTMNSSWETYFRKSGSKNLQFSLNCTTTGHLRMVLYNPTFSLV